MTDRPSLKMNWIEKLLWAMHMHELAWKVRDCADSMAQHWLHKLVNML